MGAVAGPEIERLVQLLARLPGLGPRSARRAALHLIKKREALMMPLSSAMQVALDKVQVCKTCGNIDTQNPCTVCTDPKRDPSIIVVVADVADLWALERANATQGRYHVLGATLSPLDGVGPQDLTIDALVARAHNADVQEIILALNAASFGGIVGVPLLVTLIGHVGFAGAMYAAAGAMLVLLLPVILLVVGRPPDHHGWHAAAKAKRMTSM